MLLLNKTTQPQQNTKYILTGLELHAKKFCYLKDMLLPLIFHHIGYKRVRIALTTNNKPITLEVSQGGANQVAHLSHWFHKRPDFYSSLLPYCFCLHGHIMAAITPGITFVFQVGKKKM